MNDRETTRETLETALQMMEGAARHMNGMNDYMSAALRLFVVDPPDTDFQRGYLEALKVFANETMGFKWDDPLLWGAVEPAPEPPRKPKLIVIDGRGAGDALQDIIKNSREKFAVERAVQGMREIRSKGKEPS